MPRGWARLRRAVLDERGWRCSVCERPGALEIHHIDGDPTHNAAADNLVVLCRACHIDLHKPPVSAPVAAWQRFVEELK